VIGWRARLALSPFAGLATCVVVFLGTSSSVMLIAYALGLFGVCGPVPGTLWWLTLPLLPAPPVVAVYSGYVAFNALATHVADE
jgi:hypothetical protein